MTKYGKSFNAFLLVAAGASMNAIRAVQRGKSPFGTLLAGILFGAICVGINDLSRKDLGTLLAGVFLLSSALVSGVPLIDSMANVAESYDKGTENG